MLPSRRNFPMRGAESRIRTRRRLPRALAALLAIGLLAACADNSPTSGSSGPALSRTAEPGASESDAHVARIGVGIMGKIPQLDPTKRVEEGLTFNANIMEPLLRIDADGQIQPWLATGFEAVSDTVYEYTLREGVTFWNGEEMTSEDVKYSWDRLIDSGTRADFASVDTVEAPDPYTIRVTLKEPDASWQYAPAMFYSVIYEKSFAENAGAAFGRPATLVMGTGPWKVDNFNPTTGLELSAHDDYWGGKPPINRVSVKFFADNSSMALALRAGEIDIAPNINKPESFDAAAGGGTTTTRPICSTSVISMPTQTAPFDDVHVRRAVAYAINRDDIIAATRGRGSDPNYTLFTPSSLRPLASEEEVDAALDDVKTYRYDVDKAREELAMSSVSDGVKVEFKTLAAYSPVAEVIAAQLEEIGIDVEVVQMTDTAWYGAIGSDSPPFTFTEHTVCNPDPSGSAIFLTNVNMANYEPAEVGDLLTNALATQDPEQRLEMYADLLERLGEDVPYVPVYAESNTYASIKYDIVEYDGKWTSFPWLLNVVPK